MTKSQFEADDTTPLKRDLCQRQTRLLRRTDKLRGGFLGFYPLFSYFTTHLSTRGSEIGNGPETFAPANRFQYTDRPCHHIVP